jgi:hypothetical protein
MLTVWAETTVAAARIASIMMIDWLNFITKPPRIYWAFNVHKFLHAAIKNLYVLLKEFVHTAVNTIDSSTSKKVHGA